MAQAPVEFRLASGKIYQATPFTERDICELDEYIRFKYMENARKAVEYATPTERKELLSIALDNSCSLTWTQGKGREIIQSLDGVVRFAYQMIKKNTNVSLEQFRKVLLDEEHLQENIESIWETYNTVNKSVPKEVETEVIDDQKKATEKSGEFRRHDDLDLSRLGGKIRLDP